MKWFDAGVNLLDPRLNDESTLHAAIEAGVDKLCIITSQPSEWEAAKRWYERFPEHVCYTVGVHPHCAKLVEDAHWAQLRQAAESDGVVAIGECGLDFNRNFSPQPIQIQVFEKQLALAGELGLPVYLHERDAFEQQVACLAAVSDKLAGGIAHCFTGTPEQMHTYLEMGLYIGVTGWVCDPKRGDALREAVTTLPLERLVLETDAPYLFPKTLRPRKKDNLPAYLPHIGQELANLLQISATTLSQVSYANTGKLFKLLD